MANEAALAEALETVARSARPSRLERAARPRRPGGLCSPAAMSLLVHGAFLAASLYIAAGPAIIQAKPFGPFTVSILMTEPRNPFVPPRETEILPELEPVEPEADPVEIEYTAAPDDVMAVRPEEPEPEPVPREEILRMLAESCPEPEPLEVAEEDSPSESSVVRDAVPIRTANRPPRYPRLALRFGYEGRVLLEVEVLSDGSVGHVRVVELKGHRVFAEAAMRAVRGWRFSPATRGGSALSSRIVVPVSFVLATAGSRG